MSWLKYAAIAGNIIFILWILYNGIDEKFSGTLVEKFSFLTLTCLLTVNCILLIRRKR